MNMPGDYELIALWLRYTKIGDNNAIDFQIMDRQRAAAESNAPLDALWPRHFDVFEDPAAWFTLRELHPDHPFHSYIRNR